MEKVKLTIDGKEVEVEKGTNLIKAAKTVGVKIPHFCYHAGLSPDGNCRMCLVRVDKMPKPVIGCMTGAAEGMVVHTNTEEVAKMRRSIMEFLLIDHPLDCPTCDQAGECKLQDYYMQYDKIPSRFEEFKVQKRKMVDLGAEVMLDEERCIACTRCVRFCQEIAKNEELYVMERGNRSMVTIFPGKPLSNPYAGCTVDVCPVGALTSKDFRYKKRVWYLTATDSICPGCSRGCNITVEHADKQVYRLKPRLNPDVNQHWMCDFGRNDYKFINDHRRLRPAYRLDGQLVDADYDLVSSHFRNLAQNYKPSEVAFVASALESNEAIDAFCDFAKSFGGADLCYSSNQPKNAYSDDILITADKNPNSAHIAKKGIKKLSDLHSSVKALIVQRSLGEDDLQWIKSKNIKVLVLFSTNEGPTDKFAETILPIPTYAEQSGHFTNLNGLVQKFKKALEPKGQSKCIQDYLQDLMNSNSELKQVG